MMGAKCDSAETSRTGQSTTTHCNGSWAFFPTEVPQSQFRSCRMPGSRLPVSVVQREDPELGRAVRAEGPGALESRRNQRNQGSVREQIKQVVTELEDVLGGLKQVQLEMREVVQQIDLLTSNIDLKEDPGHHGDCFGVVEIIQDSEGDAESLQQGGVRTTLLQSEGGLAAGTSGRRDLDVACPPAHGPVAKESADSKRAVATCAQCTNSVANGDCLPARPPKAKVKELWHQRRKTDHVAPSKPPKPPFPLAGLIKTQRPLPCPQNGQVKMALQESNQPPDIMKIPHYPGKQKQFPSTVV
ncbi:uncharacterized protein si:ch211-178n15.1 [Electrophorus electricus]|uniref:uncharacterized protein si:ch211-178n15.1 n=1 Tax=Electrophorus electricus TaxID=8005 RepID=UPI0015D051D3|nr:uncharacterized protein si:ch211-178n15.1 [Electrophorus electricus]